MQRALWTRADGGKCGEAREDRKGGNWRNSSKAGGCDVRCGQPTKPGKGSPFFLQRKKKSSARHLKTAGVGLQNAKIALHGAQSPRDTPATRMEIRTWRSAIANLKGPPPGAPSGALGEGAPGWVRRCDAAISRHHKKKQAFLYVFHHFPRAAKTVV